MLDASYLLFTYTYLPKRVKSINALACVLVDYGIVYLIHYNTFSLNKAVHAVF